MSNAIDIVIADDEPYIIRSLSFIFEKEGFSFKTARDGKEALALIKNFKPKIVFLDIMMPEMSGYEVCQAIRSDTQLKDLYVIMFTAKGQMDDKEKAEMSGSNEYITKPFSPNDIISRVKKILQSIEDKKNVF